VPMFRAAVRPIFALFLVTATLSATVTVPTEFKEIVAGAGLIARGRVTDVRAVAARRQEVETVATIAVDAVLKGDPVDFVTLRVPGGVIGRYRWVMVGAPTMTVGQEGVFFLKRDAALNAWRPVGLGMGIYRVQPEPATGRPVVAPPIVAGRTAAIGPVVRGDVSRRFMAVPEFESLIRVVMAGQAAPVQRGSR
jgi:hypothetical protein